MLKLCEKLSLKDPMTAEATDAISPITQTMYLQSLDVAGFRSCASVTIELQPTLTLLVGENNAGKSNVIDALRLATLPLSGRRTRYFEIEDVSRHHDGPITLTAHYAGLT
jgi:putative ATP-dependent endonuclease of OLD family